MDQLCVPGEIQSISFDSVIKLAELIRSPAFNSEEAFNIYLQGRKTDYDMNPIEDFIIMGMYLNYYSVVEISKVVKRPERAINLRLRMFLTSHTIEDRYDDKGRRDEVSISTLLGLLKIRSDHFVHAYNMKEAADFVSECFQE